MTVGIKESEGLQEKILKAYGECTSGETTYSTAIGQNVTNAEAGEITTHGIATNTINTHQTSVQYATRASTTGK